MKKILLLLAAAVLASLAGCASATTAEDVVVTYRAETAPITGKSGSYCLVTFTVSSSQAGAYAVSSYDGSSDTLKNEGKGVYKGDPASDGTVYLTGTWISGVQLKALQGKSIIISNGSFTDTVKGKRYSFKKVQI